MVVIREAEIVINPVDNVTPALSRLANMISGRFSGVRMVIRQCSKTSFEVACVISL